MSLSMNNEIILVGIGKALMNLPKTTEKPIDRRDREDTATR